MTADNGALAGEVDEKDEAFELTPNEPSSLLCLERFTRAQGYHEQTLEKLRNVSLWVEFIRVSLEHDPLNFESFRTSAAACAETWNDAMRLQEAFEALIGAQGSA